MNRFKVAIVAAASAMLLSVAMTGAAFAAGNEPDRKSHCPSGTSGTTTNTNTNCQKASNTAVVQQTAVGVSGDALADRGSTATSGSVTVVAVAVQEQGNVQLAANQVRVGGSPVFASLNNQDDKNSNRNRNYQKASNRASCAQNLAGVSGTAAADRGSTSTTGTVVVSAACLQTQNNLQIGLNQLEIELPEMELPDLELP